MDFSLGKAVVVLLELILGLAKVLICEVKEILEGELENWLDILAEGLLEGFSTDGCHFLAGVEEGAVPDWKDLAHVCSNIDFAFRKVNQVGQGGLS
jgi:hypothetical protein